MTETDKQTDRQTDRQTEKDRDRETERHRDRQRQRDMNTTDTTLHNVQPLYSRFITDNSLRCGRIKTTCCDSGVIPTVHSVVVVEGMVHQDVPVAHIDQVDARGRCVEDRTAVIGQTYICRGEGQPWLPLDVPGEGLSQ